MYHLAMVPSEHPASFRIWIRSSLVMSVGRPSVAPNPLHDEDAPSSQPGFRTPERGSATPISIMRR
jgi:hypothetical protein